MDHQNGEPPGQNAIAGGARVVARARPGAILAREPRGRENAMKRSLHGLIADGRVGGVLAGLVVALWFRGRTWSPRTSSRDSSSWGISTVPRGINIRSG